MLENSFYTFIITSAINTKHTQIPRDTRFRQTLETIDSIRDRVPNAKIVFCDSSVVPIDGHEKILLKSLVDLWVDHDHTLFTHYLNEFEHRKGMNELLSIEKCLNEAKKHNLIGRRVFKISGRYLLHKEFDITRYEHVEYHNKYVFKTQPWIVGIYGGEENRYNFYVTALWSMCHTLVDNYLSITHNIFKLMMENQNMEMAHNMSIPQDKLIIVDRMYFHGILTNGTWMEF